MKRYILEIIRQKWRLLGVMLLLLLLNVILAVVVSAYQRPLVADLQTQWSNLRRQAAQSGTVDAATLHRQGGADLEKLKERIPEKRQFARVLGDLFEAAASSAVELGPLSYKPERIKEEALLSYQLSYSASGSYAAVKSYLADLQKNPELIVVDSVDFSNSDLFAENVVMNIKLSIYLREGA